MSPVNRRFNRTRSQRRFNRRRRRGGPIRQLVRKQRRWQRKKSNFRFLKRIDTGIGFQYAKYEYENTALAMPAGAGTNPTYASISVTLALATAQSQIIAAFSKIYEYYRIRKVVVSIIPNFTVVGGAASAGGYPPYFVIGSIFNWDNDTAPLAGSGDYTNWPNGSKFKETRGVKWHTRVFRPVPTDQVADTSSAASFTNTKMRFSPWISTTDTTVYHYGLLFYIRVVNGSYPTVTDTPFRLRLRIYYAFKSFSRYAS